MQTRTHASRCVCSRSPVHLAAGFHPNHILRMVTCARPTMFSSRRQRSHLHTHANVLSATHAHGRICPCLGKYVCERSSLGGRCRNRLLAVRAPQPRSISQTDVLKPFTYIYIYPCWAESAAQVGAYCSVYPVYYVGQIGSAGSMGNPAARRCVSTGVGRDAAPDNA